MGQALYVGKKTMNHNPIRIYTSMLIKTMGTIEDITKKPFEQIDNDLSIAVESAIKNENLKHLRVAYNKLCKLHDNLTMD